MNVCFMYCLYCILFQCFLLFCTLFYITFFESLFVVSFLFFCTLFLIQFWMYILFLFLLFFVYFLRCFYLFLHFWLTFYEKSIASLQLVFILILYLFFDWIIKKLLHFKNKSIISEYEGKKTYQRLPLINSLKKSIKV